MSNFVPDEVKQDHPNWELNAGRPSSPHDWRNYIGERTREIWSTLSEIQRIALATDAEERASNEEWD